MDDKQIEIRMPVDLHKIKATFILGLNFNEFIGVCVTFCISLALYFFIPNEVDFKLNTILAQITICAFLIFFKFQNSTLFQLFLPFVETTFFNIKLYGINNTMVEIGVDIDNERRNEIKNESRVRKPTIRRARNKRKFKRRKIKKEKPKKAREKIKSGYRKINYKYDEEIQRQQ